MNSQKVIELINNPVNLGKIQNPDGEGTIEDRQSGDTYSIYIKVEFGIITKISFWTNGDREAIASCSMITTLAKGKNLSEALKISKQDIIDALESASGVKHQSLDFVIGTLRKAIYNYLLRRGIY